MESECLCPGCGNAFKDPRILPCNHVYCTACIARLNRSLPDPSDPNKVLGACCFLCRTPFTLLNGHAESLPLSMEHIDLVAHWQGRGSAAKPKCQRHKDDTAVAWCHGGCGSICRECYTAHQSAIQLKTHRLEEYLPNQRQKFPTLCPRHHLAFGEYCSEEPTKNPFMCSECTKTHNATTKPHVHNRYEVGVQEVLRELDILKVQLNEKERTLQSQQDELRSRVHHLENYVADMKRTATTEFQKARKLIEEEERMFFEKIDKYNKTELAFVSATNEQLSFMKTHTNHSLKLIDNAVEIYKVDQSPVKLPQARVFSKRVLSTRITNHTEHEIEFTEGIPRFIKLNSRETEPHSRRFLVARRRGRDDESDFVAPAARQRPLSSMTINYFVSIFSTNESRKPESMEKLKLKQSSISSYSEMPLLNSFFVKVADVPNQGDILKKGSFDFEDSIFHASLESSIDIQILSDFNTPGFQHDFKDFLDENKVTYSNAGGVSTVTLTDLSKTVSILMSNPFVWKASKINWSPISLYFRGITNMEIYQGLLSFFVAEKIEILSVTVEIWQQFNERLVKVIFFRVKEAHIVFSLKRLQIGSAFVHVSQDGKSFFGEEVQQPRPSVPMGPASSEAYMKGYFTPVPPPMESAFTVGDFRPEVLPRYIHICDHIRNWEYQEKVWNPQAWLQVFGEYERRRKLTINPANPRGNLDEVRPMRVLVMLNTIKLFRAGSYKNSKGQTISIPQGGQNAFYKVAPAIPGTLRSFRHTVQVIDMDCLEAARTLILESRGVRNIAVLNMASKFTPGGGYKKGDAAQEENLFRRTNYCTQLDSAWESENPGMSAQGYPMEPLGGAYTKNVTVFRGLESNGYPLLDEAFQCDFVAVYAIKSERNRLFGMSDYHETQKKIETIFKICLDNNCEAIVLGALGCGAYNNPPKVVAEAFSSALQEYGHFFKKIIFAVRDDHNSAHNFEIFKNTLDGVSINSGMSVQVASTPPCRYGGLCHDKKPAHQSKYRHPYQCHITDCKNRDEAHRFYFSH